MRLNFSIRDKILLSTLLILLLSYVILTFISINNIETFINGEINKQLEEQLRYARSEYQARANLVGTALAQPAGSPLFHERMQSLDRQWLRDTMQRWQKNLSFVDLLSVVDAQGRVVARLANDQTGDQAEPGMLIARAMRERRPQISTELFTYQQLCRDGLEKDCLPQLIKGEAITVISVVPIVTAKGIPLGAIVAGDILNRDPYLPHQVRQIFGGETVVSIIQRRTKVASSLAGDAALSDGLTPEIEAVLRRGGSYRGDLTMAGKRYRVTFEPLLNGREELIGALSVGISRESMRGIRRDSERTIIISASLAIILSVLIAWLMARRLTKPLKELSAGVRRIEAGDINQRVRIDSADEVGELAEAFNRMASALVGRDRTITAKTRALEEMNEQLEQMVAERTIQLRMEMGLLEAVLTSMAEGVVVTDQDSRVVHFNPAAQRIFDLVPHRVMKRRLDQLEEGSPLGQLAAFLKKLQPSGGETDGGREEEMTLGGRFLRVNLSPLHDGGGGFAGAVMSIRDVTAEQEVDRMKNEFISTVSHELKTPLTSIKGSLQFILGKGKWLTETERELLEICERNTERLIRLINSILDISKIESGRVELHFRPLAVGELVVYAIEEMRGFAMNRSISVVNSVDSDLPPVFGDHDRLVQVLTNLLSNAIKFSPEGKVVMVTARREAKHVVISVADHGRSIGKRDQDKLFRKFQQLGGVEPGEYGGTGLGLAICKEIIERHHGKIIYQPGLHGGNVFSFSVPIYQEVS